MSSEFPVDRVTWVAIEPVISKAIECLRRRREVLEKEQAGRDKLVERVEQILGKPGPHKGTSEAEVVECSIEADDVAWGPKINELVHALNRKRLWGTADDIGRRLSEINSSVPPMPCPCLPDATDEEVEAVYDEQLAHFRGRAEAEEIAVRWLLDFLQAIQSEQANARDFSHSADFRSVFWSGTPYTFTKSQAACVKVLWVAWEACTPELDGLTVVTQADVSQTRLIDVFRSKGKAHPAWGAMIVQGQSKGAYRLNDATAVVPPKVPRTQSRKTTRKTHR